MTLPREGRPPAFHRSPPPPTVRNLEALAAIVRTGSRPAAAQALGVTLTTIAHHLDKLMLFTDAATTTHAAAILYAMSPTFRDLVGDPAEWGGRRVH